MTRRSAPRPLVVGHQDPCRTCEAGCGLKLADVRLWHLADLHAAVEDVCLQGQSGRA
jgi:hypothetical protein